MRRQSGFVTAVSAILVALSLGASACTMDSSVEAARSDQVVNPGAALSPTANKDWYELIAREKQHAVSPEAMDKDLVYQPMLRHDGSRIVDPNWITSVAQTLSDGTTVRGCTLRYDDRIALLITPTDKVIDPETEARKRVVSPDVTGETRLWRVVKVRGTTGLARSATTQKWESGDVIVVPSVVEWQVASGGPAPYLTYALVGDVPVERLISIAHDLR